ncbi:unnamed protein product [Orchesella dallaii]|uniref:Uncharacterized protein n=1 Tax=Orchesella dallaii TaxID=48710 RepID=A0ABP1QC46_9HEXA
MVFNPCPCFPLQKAVKLLAIFDGILSAVNLLLLAAIVIGLATHPEEFQLSEDDKATVVPIAIIDTTFSIVQVYIAIKLYIGAVKEDIGKCKVWLVVTTFIDLIEICSSLQRGEEFNAATSRLFFIIVAYKIYAILVVLAFIKELGKDSSTAAVTRSVAAFNLEGMYHPHSNQHSNVYYTTLQPIPYNEKQINFPLNFVTIKE